MKDQATPNGQQAPQDEQTEIRDRRRRSWIWVESALIDLYGARIGPYGIAAYVTLSRFANNETQTAFPSLRKLAKLAGMTVLTLRKTLQDLARLNLIRITPRVSAKGDRDTNIYTLIEVPLDPPRSMMTTPILPPSPSLRRHQRALRTRQRAQRGVCHLMTHLYHRITHGCVRG